MGGQSKVSPARAKTGPTADASDSYRPIAFFNGPPSSPSAAHLGNVIHAVARLQDVGLVPLEGSLPAPVRALPDDVQKSEPGAGVPAAPAKWHPKEPADPAEAVRHEYNGENGPIYDFEWRREYVPTKLLLSTDGAFGDEWLDAYREHAEARGKEHRALEKLYLKAPEKMPLTVVRHDNVPAMPPLHYAIDDGHHRAAIAYKHGLPHVPALVGYPKTQKSEAPQQGPDGGTLEKMAPLEVDPMKLGQALPQFLSDPKRTRKALSYVVKPERLNKDPWRRGGCYLLSRALADHIGPQAQVVGFRHADQRPGVQEHAAVKVGNHYIDATGAYPAEELQARMPGAVEEPISHDWWKGQYDEPSHRYLLGELRKLK